jgi:hypothetical protein
MAMTTDSKIQLGQLGLQGITGLLGGLNNKDEKNRALNEQHYQESRDDEFFAMLLQALQNQSNTEQDLSSENLQRAMAFTNANPLGSENDYRKKNTLGLAGLEALSGRQLARGIPSIANGFTDRPGVREAYSDANVDEAIRQRRIATAGIDPRAAQEIGGSGSDYASRLFGELQGSQNNRRANSAAAFDMIGDRRMELAQAQAAQQEQEKDKPGFWKKLGSAVLPVAGLAANFIPGVGPIAGALISGATGAAGGALSGGKKGALLGGAAGAAAGYGMSKAGIGEPNAPRTFNNSMTPASRPVGNMAAPQGQLNLQSSPSGGFAGLAQSVAPQRPMIQQALSRPPQAAPQAPTSNVPPFRFGQGVPQSDNGFSGNFNMFGNNINTSDLLKKAQQPSLGQATGMRAPTMSERFADFGANVGQVGRNVGMPTNTDWLSRMGHTQAPPVETVLDSPMGRAATLGMAGGLGNSVRSAQPALGGIPYGQRLLGPGQPALNAGRPAGYLPEITDSGMEAQSVVSKLMDALKAYKGDQTASQQIIDMMQPYLAKIGR